MNFDVWEMCSIHLYVFYRAMLMSQTACLGMSSKHLKWLAWKEAAAVFEREASLKRGVPQKADWGTAVLHVSVTAMAPKMAVTWWTLLMLFAMVCVPPGSSRYSVKLSYGCQKQFTCTAHVLCPGFCFSFSKVNLIKAQLQTNAKCASFYFSRSLPGRYCSCRGK